MRFLVAVAMAVSVTGAGACQQSADNSAVNPGNVRLGGEARPSKEPSPAEGNAVSCRIHTLRLDDVSSQRVLEQSTVHDALVASLEGRFGAVGAGGEGLELGVEYLVYRRELDEDVLFLGTRALLRHADAASSLSLEATASRDMPTPGECREDLSSPACAAVIAKSLLPPVLDQLSYRSYLVCSLESLPAEEVGTLLGSGDAWERMQAVRAVGERKLVSLASQVASLLDDPEFAVAMSAIGALGRLSSDSVIEPLVRKAARAPADVVSAVAVALMDTGLPRAREYVSDWAQNHPLPEVKERCARLLETAPSAP